MTGPQVGHPPAEREDLVGRGSGLLDRDGQRQEDELVAAGRDGSLDDPDGLVGIVGQHDRLLYTVGRHVGRFDGRLGEPADLGAERGPQATHARLAVGSAAGDDQEHRPGRVSRPLRRR